METKLDWIKLTKDESTWPPDMKDVLFVYKYPYYNKRIFKISHREKEWEGEAEKIPFIVDIPENFELYEVWWAQLQFQEK